MAVDVDVSEFPALKAGFMVVRVVMGEGHVVAVSPSDFCVSDHILLFLD